MKANSTKPSLTPYDDIFSTEESRTADEHEKVITVSIHDLHPFKDHPFRVLDDDRMKETVESVKEFGVLVPLIARPLEEGGYEIVSGHRRKRACELAGIEELPVLVRDLDDDEAVIIMVDSNLQRENILPSERAKAYQMKLEAIKRKAGRPSRENCDQVGHNFPEKRSVEILAENAPDSRNQIQRFIRLNNLEPSLMDRVDKGELAFTPAVELSYLKPEEQQWMHEALNETQQTPSLSQAQRIKKESKEGTLSAKGVLEILSEEKKPLYDSVTLSHDTLKHYFPKSYTTKQMEKVILKLLDAWLKKRQMSQER